MTGCRQRFAGERCRLSTIALLVLLAACTPWASAEDLKMEDVVAKHLDSIGTVDSRAASKSRIIQGTSAFKIRVGGGGEMHGTSSIVSDGRKSVFMLKLP